jgi:hypothetical protein
VAPILLIDETLDAPTPYTGSLEVRKRYPQASLLAEPGGTSHADSLFGNECVDNTIADYLATGTLPRAKPVPDRTRRAIRCRYPCRPRVPRRPLVLRR